MSSRIQIERKKPLQSNTLRGDFQYRGHQGHHGYYLISDGGVMPYGVRIRTSSFPHLQTILLLSCGLMVADLIAIRGSIDFVMADVDR